MRKLLHASVSGRAGCFHFHSIAWPNHGKENPPFAEGAVTGYFRRNRFGLAAYAASEYGLFMARDRKAKKLCAIMRRRLETREFSRR